MIDVFEKASQPKLASCGPHKYGLYHIRTKLQLVGFTPPDQPAASFGDLGVLSPLRRILALVVAMEQKDDLVPVSVAEDTEKNPVMLGWHLIL